MELKEKAIVFIKANATTLLHKVSICSWVFFCLFFFCCLLAASDFTDRFSEEGEGRGGFEEK